MSYNKLEAQLMVELYQLLPSRSYKAIVSLRGKEKWTSTLAVLGTFAGPNLIEESFALARHVHR